MSCIVSVETISMVINVGDSFSYQVFSYHKCLGNCNHLIYLARNDYDLEKEEGRGGGVGIYGGLAGLGGLNINFEFRKTNHSAERTV